MSPLVWDLAHVGNYEELWLLRVGRGHRPDAAGDRRHLRRVRAPAGRAADPAAARARRGAGLHRHRARQGARLARRRCRFGPTNPLLDKGFVYGMVVQHEHQHDETMLATHQLRRGAAVLGDATPAGAADAARPAGRGARPRRPLRHGHLRRRLGLRQRAPGRTRSTSRRSGSTRRPCTNRAYAVFVEAGGYDDPRWWSEAGWAWRSTSGKRHPRSGCGGRPVAAPPVRPRRAAAARAAGAARLLPRGRRLRAVGRQAAADRGRVGEGRVLGPGRRPQAALPLGRRAPRRPSRPTSASGTSSRRRSAPTRRAPRPTACARWSATSGSGRRAGSPATPASARSPTRSTPRSSSAATTACCAAARGRPTRPLSASTFRNWDHPIRRQIFSGFRCARDAAPGEGV